MKTKCLLCGKEFVNILEHISIYHNISSPEEYNQQVKKEEDKKVKILAFLKYSEELMEKRRRGEISPEKLRELRAKWEMDNKLIW